VRNDQRLLALKMIDQKQNASVKGAGKEEPKQLPLI